MPEWSAGMYDQSNYVCIVGTEPSQILQAYQVGLGFGKICLVMISLGQVELGFSMEKFLQRHIMPEWSAGMYDQLNYVYIVVGTKPSEKKTFVNFLVSGYLLAL